MDSIWLQILTFALPSGFISSVVTWLVSRQQRRNDFLSQMQKSIDLLSEKYNAVLRDNVTLRQEKAEWQVTQQELLLKVDKLTKEVESLRKNINKQQKENESTNPGKSPRTSARHLPDDGLCNNKDADHADLRTGRVGDNGPKNRRRTNREPCRPHTHPDAGSDGADPDSATDDRGHSGREVGNDDSDSEPPESAGRGEVHNADRPGIG